MRQRLDWSPADAAPSRAAVLDLQGLPPERSVPAHIDALFDAAMGTYFDLAEPRALVAEISTAGFGAVYRGEGRNARETPLETIYPKAVRLALVAATIGDGVSRAVHDLFQRHDLALGCMLDALGSAAADHLVDLVIARSRAMSAVQDSADYRVLAYSPGYCGWHVSGQRALFAFLHPEEIGITLNPSCLMQPLKSISGVLVGGHSQIHRFHPTYSFCENCREKPCRERMASVLKR